ncbi:MAG: alpha-amylase family glycosyl hydrolase [bacterium]|jgi:alpha-amylase
MSTTPSCTALPAGLRSRVTGLALLAGLAASLAAALPAAGQATVAPTERRSVFTREAVPQAIPGWWNDAVFYQVFVRSFADSAAGPKAGDGIGDFAGLIERLDYLNDGKPETTTDLGVTALWLMPITQSPSYHGYDTTDYYTIEEDYGTNADFQRFMAECRKRGIKVIIDTVLNHHSDKHPWFTRAIDPAGPYHDWYLFSPKNPGWRGPWNQQVWHEVRPAQLPAGAPPAAVSQFYYGLFSREMPDLNYRNQAVTDEMLKMIRWWHTEMKVDGFRLDAIRHLIEDGQQQDNTLDTHRWLEMMGRDLYTLNPDLFTVGEVWAPTADARLYVGGREKPSDPATGRDNLSPKLRSVFEFDLATFTVEAARDGSSVKLNGKLREVLAGYPASQFCTFLANHDQPRVLTMLKGNRPAAAAAATVQFALPGIPFVYYGEEIGMLGDKPDPDIRTPMQWTADPDRGGFTSGTPWRKLNPDTPKVNVAAQTADPASMLSHYRRLISARRGNDALRRGDTTPLQPSTPALFAVLRHTPDRQGVLAVVNLTAEPVKGASLTGTPPVAWQMRKDAADLLTGAPVRPLAPTELPDLPPYGALYIPVELTGK